MTMVVHHNNFKASINKPLQGFTITIHNLLNGFLFFFISISSLTVVQCQIPHLHQHPCQHLPPHLNSISSTAPTINKQHALWSSENDHKLLITGWGLNCHLFEYGKMDAKFKLLADTLCILGIDFTPRTVQAKFEKLLKEACEEMHLDLMCMGYEKACLEAEEEATQMVEEADNWVHIQEVSFYLGFFTCWCFRWKKIKILWQKW